MVRFSFILCQPCMHITIFDTKYKDNWLHKYLLTQGQCSAFPWWWLLSEIHSCSLKYIAAPWKSPSCLNTQWPMQKYSNNADHLSQACMSPFNVTWRISSYCTWLYLLHMCMCHAAGSYCKACLTLWCCWNIPVMNIRGLCSMVCSSLSSASHLSLEGYTIPKGCGSCNNIHCAACTGCLLQVAWFHAKHTLEFQCTKPIVMLPCFL